MGYCRRCSNSKFGTCSLGYSKSDQQIRNENFGCFSEVILRVYDTEETKDAILAEKGAYGDAFKQVEIGNEIKRLMRLRDSMLVRVGV